MRGLLGRIFLELALPEAFIQDMCYPRYPLLGAECSQKRVCYSCAPWTGTLFSATAKSQPWIWAWNPDQGFPVFFLDARLEMHAHRPTSGGFGIFYVGMACAVNTASGPFSLPPGRRFTATLGTLETLAGLWAAFLAVVLSAALHLHALLMGIAFFVLFPAGIFTMRSGIQKAFRYH